MKAVVYKGPFSVSVEEVADPRVEQPTDALVRITTANICGSVLHMYEAAPRSRRARHWATRTWGWLSRSAPGLQRSPSRLRAQVVMR